MDLKKPYKFKGTNNIGCLLIHGFTSTPAVMYPLAQVLKKEGYTVKAVLLSGHGTKPEDLLDVSYMNWYDDVEKAYEELLYECEEVIVIGHSMGGLLALMLSSRYNIDKLICLACALKPSNKWVKYTGILKHIKKYTSWKSSSDENKERNEYDLAYKTFPIHSVHQLHLATKAANDCLSKVKADTLIIQDKNDSQVKKEAAEIIYNSISSKEKDLIWIENATHSLTIGPKKEQVFEAILNFIKKSKVDLTV